MTYSTDGYINTALTAIKTTDLSSFTAVTSMKVFLYTPPTVTIKGVIQPISYSNITIRIELNSGANTKYIMFYVSDDPTTFQSIIQQAAQILTDIIAGTATDAENVVIDRGRVIDFRGVQI